MAGRTRGGGREAEDPALARYLEGLDLEAVDAEVLDAVELPPVAEVDHGPARLAAGLGLWGLAVGLEATDTYQLHGDPWWLAALVAAGVAVAGLEGLGALGRGLWAVWRHLGGERPRPADRRTGLAPGQARALLLVAGLALVATAVGLASGGETHGSMRWLATALAGLGGGGTLARWLILRAEHDRLRARPPSARRRPAPAWTKWATLGGLVGAALWVLGEGSELTLGRFGRTGLGFGVGLGVALWLSRRIDEQLALDAAARRRAEGEATLTAAAPSHTGKGER